MRSTYLDKLACDSWPPGLETGLSSYIRQVPSGEYWYAPQRQSLCTEHLAEQAISDGASTDVVVLAGAEGEVSREKRWEVSVSEMASRGRATVVKASSMV